jgi:hypothetical protein
VKLEAIGHRAHSRSSIKLCLYRFQTEQRTPEQLRNWDLGTFDAFKGLQGRVVEVSQSQPPRAMSREVSYTHARHGMQCLRWWHNQLLSSKTLNRFRLEMQEDDEIQQGAGGECDTEWRVKDSNYKQGKKKLKAVTRAIRSVDRSLHK